MVAPEAVNAALRWIGQHTFFQTGVANFLGDVLFSWKRFASSFVFDELHAEKQSEAANISDVRMRLQRREGSAQVLPGGTHAIKKFMRFEIVQNSVARGRANRMSLIRETVHKSATAAFECLDDARGNEHGAERRVTAGDSFPHQNHVRLDVPLLDAKCFFERAVVAEPRRNVSQFRDEWFVRHAASHISADGHGAKSAAVIALAARENAVALFLAGFDVKLAREFYGRFGGFGAAGSEVDPPANAEIRRRHRQQARGQVFRWSGVKVRRGRE